jgi:hypothetical protein
VTEVAWLHISDLYLREKDENDSIIVREAFLDDLLALRPSHRLAYA